METKSIFSNLYTSKYFEKLPDFKQKKTQAFITIALTLFAISFFGIFAINPTISTILNLRKQKEDNSFVEEKLNQKFTNLNTLAQTYRDITSDLVYVYNAVPQTPQVTKLVGQLATLGKEEDVEVARLQTFEVDLTKTEINVQKFSTVKFSLDATGSYQNLLNYMETITSFERIITIDSVSLRKGTDKNSDIKLNIQGTAFFKQ